MRIEDDVEVGACTCIDRATLGETVIGRGTKIDNLVQIAHNVKVGPLSLLCAQAGVSGSAELGQGVVLAGQVGVAGHLRSDDLARVAAPVGRGPRRGGRGAARRVPALEHRGLAAHRRRVEKLPELLKELRALKQRVEELERRANLMSSEAKPVAEKPVMDIDEIQKLLPHRYPFLLVDRVMRSCPAEAGRLQERHRSTSRSSTATSPGTR